MTSREIRNLAVEKRLKLPEVRRLIDEYIQVQSDFHDYNLRILDFMLGGRDNSFVVAVHDKTSHKPVIVNYKLEG